MDIHVTLLAYIYLINLHFYYVLYRASFAFNVGHQRNCEVFSSQQVSYHCSSERGDKILSCFFLTTVLRQLQASCDSPYLHNSQEPLLL